MDNMDTSNFDNAEHTLKQYEDDKLKTIALSKKWDKNFSSLSKDEQKQVGSIHSDISKMMDMIKTGNIDSEFIEKMKLKHADKGNK